MDLEATTEETMHEIVKLHPVWPWLNQVKGIGPQTASLMLGYLLSPREDKGPSSWYKAAGLYVIQTDKGESRLPRYDHLEKGEKATWHPRIRRNLYVVGTSLMKAKGFYYDFYTEVKDALKIKHPDWKGRTHSVAFWKMIKLFLAHCYEAWAEAEGIKAREPYPIEILGHRKIARPH